MAKKTKLSKDELLNRAIERWERKQEEAVLMLRRSAEELVKLRRKRRRNLERATRSREIATGYAITARAVSDKLMKQVAPEEPKRTGRTGDTGMEEALDGIPAFLDRNKQLAAMPDPRTPEKRAQRREVEKQVRQAELTGKRRKMPLSGKAALDEIRKS